MAIYLLVTGGSLHVTARLFKLDEITFGRSLLTAFAVQAAVPVAILVSKVVIAVDVRAGVTVFLATTIAVQIGVVAWLFRAGVKKSVAVWAIGVVVPLVLMGMLMSRFFDDLPTSPTEGQGRSAPAAGVEPTEGETDEGERAR